MQIKRNVARLPECGKIKIGRLSSNAVTTAGNKEFRPAEKLDHFIVVKPYRGKDGNFVIDDEIHKEIGPKPTRIRVMLQFNDINMNMWTRYASYVGRTLDCQGDGETALRTRKDGTGEDKVQCPCPRLGRFYKGRDLCKPNLGLAVMLPQAKHVGSVWIYRTTGWNGLDNIRSGLQTISAVTGGILAGIPLDLVLYTKEGTKPDGGKVTIYTVGVEYPGSLNQLREEGLRRLEADARYGNRARILEQQAKSIRLIPPPNAPLPGDDPDEVIDEFYPQAALAALEAPTQETPPEAVRIELESGDEPESELLQVIDAWGEVIWTGTERKQALREYERLLQDAGTEDETIAIRESNEELAEWIELSEKISVFAGAGDRDGFTTWINDLPEKTRAIAKQISKEMRAAKPTA